MVEHRITIIYGGDIWIYIFYLYKPELCHLTILKSSIFSIVEFHRHNSGFFYFKNMKTSIIKRVPDCFYFQVSEDYKAICLYEVGEKIKCNDCAAVLLSLYENFVNSRINSRTKNPHSFSASTGYIKKCLLGHYSDKTIIEANAFLENESYISIERKKTEKSNSLPNVITLNVDHINYMLGEYCKIKVQQNYITPYVKLHNPLCKIPQGGYGILHNPLCNFPQGGYGILQTEISIKNQVLEINNINSLSVPDSLLPLDEEESKLSSPPDRKPKPSTYGINNQQVMEAYDAMRKWLNLPDYEYPPSSATFLWKKIQNNCKQILQSVGNPTKDGGDNMTSVKKYLLSVADMYKKGLFPFDSQESIGIDRIGSAGIIPYVLNYVPTKVIKQCAFGDSKVNPKYVKDFKGKWHEVKRWGNNVAYTVSGQEIQVSIAEKTAMMRYEGDITF